MSKKFTLNPLFTAGAVLLFFILLAHLTSSRPDGGIFSSLVILIVSLFQLVFFVTGLAIGVAICIAVLLAVFIAAAYLIDSQRGSAMAQQTKTAVQRQIRLALNTFAPGKFGTLPLAAASGAGGSGVMALETVDFAERDTLSSSGQRQAAEQRAAGEYGQMIEGLHQVEERLTTLEKGVQSIKSDLSECIRTDGLEGLYESMQQAEERLRDGMEARTAPLQTQLEQLTQQGENIEAVRKQLGDIMHRIGALEERVTDFAELPQQISAFREELSSKCDTLPQQVSTLREELQKQIAALQPKPSTRGRSRKKTTAQSS